MLFELGKRINKRENNLSGTHDQDKSWTFGRGGLYRTGLLLPNVQEVSQEVWDGYFAKRQEIGDTFCNKVSSKITGIDTIEFFWPLNAKYFSTFCNHVPGKRPTFIKKFS